MRIKIRLKIIIIGAISTFLMMVLALILSMFMYYNNAKGVLLDSVDNVIEEFDADVKNDSGIIDSIRNIRDYVLSNYDSSEALPTFESEEAKKAYYYEKNRDLYPANPGLIGFSALKGQFQEVLSELKSKAIASGSIVYIGYTDTSNNTNRIVYLADSRDDDKAVGFYYPGLYYDIKPTDKLSEYTDYYDLYELDGKTNKIYRIEFGSEELAVLYIQYDLGVIFNSALHFVLWLLLFLSIGIVVLVVLYYFLINKFLIKNILRLNDATLEFRQGINDSKLVLVEPEIKTKDEIKELSNSFVALENEIIDYTEKIKKITEQEEKMRLELEVASKIQKEMLPRTQDKSGLFDVFSYIKPANDVGGDFYDYFKINDDNLVLIIADVSGKGIPAALFMMRGMTIIKEKVLASSNLEEVFKNVNNSLTENNKENLFITCLLIKINIKTGELEYVNAGHENLIVIRDNKAISIEGHTNFILGGIENIEYKVDKYKLNKSDKLFLFTDGVTEANDKDGKLFGLDRLLSKLNEYSTNTPEEIVTKIANDIEAYSSIQFDDVTMLLFEYHDLFISINENPKIEDIGNIIGNLEAYFKKNNYSDEVLSKFLIIVDELYSNKVKYGFKGVINPKIIVKFKFDNDLYMITFVDNDLEFNPLERVNDPIETKELDEIEEGGLGLLIVKSFATSMNYTRIDDRNVLIITKKLK